MAPVRVRHAHRSSCRFLPLLNAVIYNLNTLFNCIALLGGLMDDTDDDYDWFFGAAGKVADTVFWAIAEWRAHNAQERISYIRLQQ
ncbi:hypothetical protein JRQ81_012226, partial [Phrynocephalus forsythii]